MSTVCQRWSEGQTRSQRWWSCQGRKTTGWITFIYLRGFNIHSQLNRWWRWPHWSKTKRKRPTFVWNWICTSLLSIFLTRRRRSTREIESRPRRQSVLSYMTIYDNNTRTGAKESKSKRRKDIVQANKSKRQRERERRKDENWSKIENDNLSLSRLQTLTFVKRKHNAFFFTLFLTPHLVVVIASRMSTSTDRKHQGRRIINIRKEKKKTKCWSRLKYGNERERERKRITYWPRIERSTHLGWAERILIVHVHRTRTRIDKIRRWYWSSQQSCWND